VAFVSDWTGDDDVYLLNVQTGQVVNLTHGPGEDRDPAFSADGRALLFRSDVGGGWAFYQIDLATGQRSPMPGSPGGTTAYRGHISWSQQPGYRYVYESYASGNLDLFVCTQGGQQQPLAPHVAGDYGPAWRPGAAQIAFTSWREGQKDLYLVNADGSGLLRLTADAADEEEPAWHPDGQRIVFVRWLEHDADLWELDLASGAITRLTRDPYPDRAPSYAPDGTLFWTRYVPGEPFEVHDPFRAGRWQLWLRDLGGQERLVPLPVVDMDVYTPAGGFALWPAGALPTPVAPTPTATLPPGALGG